MSCRSLAQLMEGGGTLCTSHSKIASSPSITDILVGSEEPLAPLVLDLGRTGNANGEECQSIKKKCHLLLYAAFRLESHNVPVFSAFC